MTDMRIDAPPGTRVCFDQLGNGRLSDLDWAKKHLREGGCYTVERTAIYGWHTDVYLNELPGIPFNSVLFRELDPPQ